MLLLNLLNQLKITKDLLEDISGQWTGIGAGSQGSDQRSQAEGFVPVKASVLVKNKGIADEGEVSCCRLEECVQTDYLLKNGSSGCVRAMVSSRA